MNVTNTKLPGVLIIEPKVFADARGQFVETFSAKRYAEAAGLRRPFVQDNVSFSARGVLRGLHYQYPHAQGKLVQVLAGCVFDVVVDIRPGSPGFGQWVSAELSAESHKQMYVPPGFAHGFVVLSDNAVFSYKCTDYYSPADEGGIVWNDPEIGIEWPVKQPIVSAKDAAYPALRQIAVGKLPPHEGT